MKPFSRYHCLSVLICDTLSNKGLRIAQIATSYSNLRIWIEIETSLSIIPWMTSAWQSSKVNGCQSLVIFGGICPLPFKWKARRRFVCGTMPETGRTREARLWALSAKFSPVRALAWLEKGQGKGFDWPIVGVKDGPGAATPQPHHLCMTAPPQGWSSVGLFQWHRA